MSRVHLVYLGACRVVATPGGLIWSPVRSGGCPAPMPARVDVPAHPLLRLRAHFAPLPDPRIERTKAHDLLDVLTIAFCAILCGANDWVAIETFGHSKRA